METLAANSNANELLEKNLNKEHLLTALCEGIQKYILQSDYPDKLKEVMQKPIKLTEKEMADSIRLAILVLKTNLSSISSINDIAKLATDSGHLIDTTLFEVTIEELSAYFSDRSVANTYFSEKHRKQLNFLV